jgi:hypothetical protein
MVDYWVSVAVSFSRKIVFSLSWNIPEVSAQLGSNDIDLIPAT